MKTEKEIREEVLAVFDEYIMPDDEVLSEEDFSTKAEYNADKTNQIIMKEIRDKINKVLE